MYTKAQERAERWWQRARSEGWGQKTLARNAGVSRETIRLWDKNYNLAPRFGELVRDSRQDADNQRQWRAFQDELDSGTQ